MPNESADFQKAIPFVLREEVGPFPNGGYLSPAEAARRGDPGGETKWGISRRAHPDLDIAGLTEAQAIEIYFTAYWQPNCASLGWPLSFAHFDCCVNVGNEKFAADGTHVVHNNARKILQRACGVEDDGYIGPVTRAAIGRFHPADLAVKAINEREKFYRSRGPWADEFRRGWLLRTQRLLRAVLRELSPADLARVEVG